MRPRRPEGRRDVAQDLEPHLPAYKSTETVALKWVFALGVMGMLMSAFTRSEQI